VPFRGHLPPLSCGRGARPIPLLSSADVHPSNGVEDLLTAMYFSFVGNYRSVEVLASFYQGIDLPFPFERLERPLLSSPLLPSLYYAREQSDGSFPRSLIPTAGFLFSFSHSLLLIKELGRCPPLRLLSSPCAFV